MCEGSGRVSRRAFLEGMFVASASVASGSYLWQHRPAGRAASGAGVPSIEDELAQMPERHMTKAEIADSVHLEIARDEAGLSLEEMTRATQPDINMEHLERLADEIKQQEIIDRHEETLAKAAEEAYTHSEPDNEKKPHKSIELGDDVIDRVRHFDEDFPDDIRLSEAEWETMLQTSRRIGAVREYVGFGNFNILSWDDMLAYARNVPAIGGFTTAEVEFLEALFYADATVYGFYGDRTTELLSSRIERKSVVKVPRSGHFLLAGDSINLFNRLQSDIGDSLILTSGVRGVPKQFDLFLAKAKHAEGNLSRASRSLAPPGYSYHTIGDFDVGKYGLGLGNFTEEFAKTNVFRQLQASGYTNIRYTVDNRLGVRFEPWHVRAV